jgi:hypothetical protein
LIEINKLEKKEREDLLVFHDAIITILTKRLTWIIVQEYYEPMLVPDAKDQRSVDEFLEYLTNNKQGPDFIWNEDTRQELRDLIKLQLQSINEDDNERYLAD